MNLNWKMILAITVALLSYAAGATTQLTDLFGVGVAKTIVSIATFVNGLLSTIVAVLSTQTALVKDVQAMPGVSCITVNENATPALASMAVDEANPKVTAATGAKTAVKNLAEDGK